METGSHPTVIVGYRHSEVERVLKDLPVHLCTIRFLTLPTASAPSGWRKMPVSLRERTAYRQRRRLWSQEILDFMLKQPEEVFLLADSDRVYDGDYFFGTENGILRRYGKELTLEERDCEYTGLAVLRAPFVPYS